MNKIRALLTISVCFISVLAACGSVAPTPLPTFIPAPTAAFTLDPAPTSLPSATPTLSVQTDTFTVEATLSESEQRNLTATCDIASDSTYGYTPENPIKVGPREFSDRLPEIKYLQNLAGPNRAGLSYQKKDSLKFGGIILDVFEITGLDKKVKLYFDTHSFAELKAPLGFTCYWRFAD